MKIKFTESKKSNQSPRYKSFCDNMSVISVELLYSIAKHLWRIKAEKINLPRNKDILQSTQFAKAHLQRRNSAPLFHVYPTSASYQTINKGIDSQPFMFTYVQLRKKLFLRIECIIYLCDLYIESLIMTCMVIPVSILSTSDGFPHIVYTNPSSKFNLVVIRTLSASTCTGAILETMTTYSTKFNKSISSSQVLFYISNVASSIS